MAFNVWICLRFFFIDILLAIKHWYLIVCITIRWIFVCPLRFSSPGCCLASVSLFDSLYRVSDMVAVDQCSSSLLKHPTKMLLVFMRTLTSHVKYGFLHLLWCIFPFHHLHSFSIHIRAAINEWTHSLAISDIQSIRQYFNVPVFFYCFSIFGNICEALHMMIAIRTSEQNNKSHKSGKENIKWNQW